MKKLVACIVMCSSACAARAESPVTLYGLLDGGVTYVTNAGGHPQVLQNSGIMRNNRWGLKGNEDLGGGWSTVFTLESGFALENGTLGQGGLEFGRQAFVGLSNRLLTLTLGRQYDMIVYEVSDFSSANYTTAYAFHQGDLDRVSGERVNSAVRLMTNDFRGFTLGALYGFGDPGTPTKTGRTLSFGFHYRNGPFAAGAAYTAVHNTAMPLATYFGISTLFGQSIATVQPSGALGAKLVNIDELQTSAAGASYDFGRWSIRGMATNTKVTIAQDSPNYLTLESTGTWHPRPDLFLSISYAFLRFVGQKYGETAATADYYLSKRSDVYASVINMKAYDGAKADLLTLATSTSNAQTAFRIGLRHLF